MKRSADQASPKNESVKKVQGPRGPYFRWLQDGEMPRTTRLSRAASCSQKQNKKTTPKQKTDRKGTNRRSLTIDKENQTPHSHSSNRTGKVSEFLFEAHHDGDVDVTASVEHLVGEDRPENDVDVGHLVGQERPGNIEVQQEEVDDIFCVANVCTLATPSHQETPSIAVDIVQVVGDPSFTIYSDSEKTDQVNDICDEINELDDIDEKPIETTTDNGSAEVTGISDIQHDSDSDDDDDDDDDGEVLAIAPDIHMTIQQKVDLLLLLATKKRHNLSFTASEDIMELAGVLSADKTFLPSRHSMKRVIEKYSAMSMTEHHMCPECEKYVGVIDSIDFKCDQCLQEFDTESNKKNGNIFLYLSLADQIKSVVQHCYDELILDPKRQKISPFNYEDIFDGKVYKQCVENGCLTMNCFVDGLQVSSTSKRSAWPVLLCINELPLHLRRKYILMAGLWLGLKKPNCQEYLKPFKQECNILLRDGITVLIRGRSVHFCIKTLMCISDTIARPLLRNSMQFNGQYGCGLCYHPGANMNYNKGKVRSYTMKNGEYALRSHEEIMNYAVIAENEGTPKMGIKGKSIFSEIEGFNVASGLDLDFFHALVNVSKRFAALWFTEQFSSRPFNISDKFAQVDARLLLVTPTSDIARAPRSLKDRSDYRGHEWFHWVVEYSIPVLKNILHGRYLNHWGRLVHAVAVLMQNSVSKTDVVYSARHLMDFVQDIDLLYGPEHVTISVHLLTHLSESVFNYGQPWTHSAFMFESFNHEIKNFVKSSNGMAKQICKGMQLRVALKNLEDEVKEYMSPSQIDYFKKMTQSSFRNNVPPHFVKGNISFLGQPKSLILSPSFLRPLQEEEIACTNLIIYERCLFEGEIYHCSNYKKTTKQNNSVVLLDNDDVFCINYFVVSDGDCYMLGKILPKNTQTKLCDLKLPHILVLQKPGSLISCFPVSLISCKLLSFEMKYSESEGIIIACINVLQNEMLR